MRPGLVQHEEKVKGDVITVFSCLTGGHGEDRDRLFSELHSKEPGATGQSCIPEG